ncbi:hypothetical protein PVAP13_8KG273600 [Panicum virgatum]|uniref:Purple acid phosphatase n=1 Tax=Panicum virgatum TaxID=38727 RepID=A0A8T0PJS5_PANVG|nr:hypothetical protein PVAP13_8KG273600 [Panicum virgatum]
MAPVGLLLVGVVTAVAGLLLEAAAPASATLPRVEHPPKAGGTLAVLAVGDWGRRGQFNQTLVAQQMGVVGQKMDIDFVISTGDNIYDDGIANTSDPLFKESFSNIYTAKSLQKPWYLVLGNHDYTGNPLAQLDPAIRNVDSRYTAIAKSFIVNSGIADFFLIDTTPFILHYWNKTKFDWRGVSPRDTYITNQLKDLGYALTESKAHGVDMYVNGHDHCLQRISSRDSHLEFLTSGGGSKAWAGKFKATPDKVEFLYDGQGFMSMRLSKTEAHLAFFDVTGKALHCWGLTKNAAAGR